MHTCECVTFNGSWRYRQQAPVCTGILWIFLKPLRWWDEVRKGKNRPKPADTNLTALEDDVVAQNRKNYDKFKEFEYYFQQLADHARITLRKPDPSNTDKTTDDESDSAKHEEDEKEMEPHSTAAEPHSPASDKEHIA